MFNKSSLETELLEYQLYETRKEKKGKKIMKKIMILAVALLSMTTAFAAEEATNATAAYNMNIKMGSLADALSLNIDQVDAVADVHKNFTADMMNAATAAKEDRAAMIDKAVLKDLKYMHSILNNTQYRKYVMLLNTTLINRGLK